MTLIMLMYNLIEYDDIHLKASESLWQYYGDKLAIGATDNIIEFSANNDNNNNNNDKNIVIIIMMIIIIIIIIILLPESSKRK